MRRIAALLTAGLVLLGLAAAPATATAEPTAEPTGHWQGERVGIQVALTQHASRHVVGAHWHGVQGFESAPVHHDGTFQTCARVRISAVLFRDYCLAGTIAGQHASGTMSIYHGAHGHRAPQPYETHHWTAAHQG